MWRKALNNNTLSYKVLVNEIIDVLGDLLGFASRFGPYFGESAIELVPEFRPSFFEVDLTLKDNSECNTLTDVVRSSLPSVPHERKARR